MRSYFYVVRVGRRPGIYPTWDEAKAEVHRFPAAEYQKFTSFPLAYEYLRVRYSLSPTVQTPKLPFLVPTAVPFIPAQEESKGLDRWRKERQGKGRCIQCMQMEGREATPEWLAVASSFIPQRDRR